MLGALLTMTALPRVLIPAAALALAGCGSEPDGPTGPEPGPDGDAGAALVFADPSLQAAVEEAAAAAGGAAVELVSLNAKERGIADLGGIAQLARLEALDLYGNEIRDLSPLAELKRLRYLDLGANRVEELSALESLKSLRVLLLADNAVAEVSALAGLDSLQSVDLTGNPLTEDAVESQVPALRQRGVAVDMTEPEEPEVPSGGGVVPGDLPIVFVSSRRTGEDWDLEVHSLDPRTGAAVNLSEDLAGAPLFSGDDTRGLPPPRHGVEPAQSADGRRIAFTSYRDYGNYEIYLTDADGGAPENLTLHEAYDANPAWSPDGERIAFISDRNGDVEVRPWRNNTDIFVMYASGRGVEQLTSDPLGRSAEHPAWSPDGSSIAFNKFDGEGFSGIFVLELSSGEVRLLTDDGLAWGPSWSPDGRWIAYVETVEYEESHVWKVPASGGEARQLTVGRFFRRGPPRWSPDGARIVLAREDRAEGIAYDLYVIPAEGGAGEQLTDDPGVDRDPCWAPF